MRKADLHVHTLYSCDSRERMEEYCLQAVRMGVDTVCFTDHVDHNPHDSGYGFYRRDEYFEDFYRVRDQYAGKVKLLSGVEFSEPHCYPVGLEGVSAYPYDFIIGSVHYWKDDLFPSELVEQGVTLEDCYGAYWPEVYKAVCHGGFDSLGHVDFPKRYYHGLLWEKDAMFEIFRKMAQKGIALEINTSSLRKGLGETMPGLEMLTLYRDAGGRVITVGSDAHCAGDLAAGGEVARQRAEALGLQEVVYIGRQQVPA